jgi:hypothetical protein
LLAGAAPQESTAAAFTLTQGMRDPLEGASDIVGMISSPLLKADLKIRQEFQTIVAGARQPAHAPPASLATSLKNMASKAKYRFPGTSVTGSLALRLIAMNWRPRFALPSIGL